MDLVPDSRQRDDKDFYPDVPDLLVMEVGHAVDLFYMFTGNLTYFGCHVSVAIAKAFEILHHRQQSMLALSSFEVECWQELPQYEIQHNTEELGFLIQGLRELINCLSQKFEQYGLYDHNDLLMYQLKAVEGRNISLVKIIIPDANSYPPYHRRAYVPQPQRSYC